MLIDITSAVCYYMGIEFIGSGMSTVLYSFIVVWTALIKRVFFGTKVSVGRWIAIFAMPVFISLSAVEQVSDNKHSMFRQGTGCILILISSLGYAWTFCLNNNLLDRSKYEESVRESLLQQQIVQIGDEDEDKDKNRDYSVHPTPTHVATMMSMSGLFVLLYICIFVAPNWSEYMFHDDTNTDEPSSNTNGGWHYGSTEYTVLFYAVFVISVGAHQQSVYHCLCHGASSAVTAGVSKSLQAAGTFLLSALIFCHSEHDQCLNTWKIIGMIGIVFFVLWYSLIDVVISQMGDDDDDHIDGSYISTPALSELRASSGSDEEEEDV
jgi:drug/metabolite transporter (DMT)-like permease